MYATEQQESGAFGEVLAPHGRPTLYIPHNLELPHVIWGYVYRG